jgi:hypothetical protein
MPEPPATVVPLPDSTPVAHGGEANLISELHGEFLGPGATSSRWEGSPPRSCSG